MEETELDEIIHENLHITTQGVSLRMKTRNYPHKLQDETRDVSELTASDLETEYIKLGKSLASPTVSTF